MASQPLGTVDVPVQLIRRPVVRALILGGHAPERPLQIGLVEAHAAGGADGHVELGRGETGILEREPQPSLLRGVGAHTGAGERASDLRDAPARRHLLDESGQPRRRRPGGLTSFEREARPSQQMIGDGDEMREIDDPPQIDERPLPRGHGDTGHPADVLRRDHRPMRSDARRPRPRRVRRDGEVERDQRRPRLGAIREGQRYAPQPCGAAVGDHRAGDPTADRRGEIQLGDVGVDTQPEPARRSQEIVAPQAPTRDAEALGIGHREHRRPQGRRQRGARSGHGPRMPGARERHGRAGREHPEASAHPPPHRREQVLDLGRRGSSPERGLSTGGAGAGPLPAPPPPDPPPPHPPPPPPPTPPSPAPQSPGPHAPTFWSGTAAIRCRWRPFLTETRGGGGERRGGTPLGAHPLCAHPRCAPRRPAPAPGGPQHRDAAASRTRAHLHDLHGHRSPPVVTP